MEFALILMFPGILILRDLCCFVTSRCDCDVWGWYKMGFRLVWHFRPDLFCLDEFSGFCCFTLIWVWVDCVGLNVLWVGCLFGSTCCF